MTKTIRLLLISGSIFVTGCASVELGKPKSYSEAIIDNTDTEFGALALQWQQIHGEQSGFFPLVDGMDALGARLSLADRAEKSIDLQYFLMTRDTAGLVIENALLKAADRGVHIRFLLDDIFTEAPDRSLQLLNQHPNIEIRLFNPVSRRGFYYLNFLANFKNANRRMHNKSFIVDNAISIIGGRNIADEYFQLKENSVFSDFDILAFGPISREISSSFDIYWNDSLAIPVEYLSNNQTNSREELLTARNNFAEQFDGIYDSVYRDALDSALLQELLSGKQSLYPADARVLMDDPDKLRNPTGAAYMQLVSEIDKVLSTAKEEVLFLSPYYVPGDNGIDYVTEMIDRGLKVTLLTNSLASNNHVAVHSGYARYRKAILDAGVNLYEVRANAGGELNNGEGPDILTLHTKLILIDRRYLFVGSLNLDHRSLEINAEMGLLIDSEELVEVMATAIDEVIPRVAYHVVKNDAGKIEWINLVDGVEHINTTEPLTSRWLRFKAWVLKIVPESQL